LSTVNIIYLFFVTMMIMVKKTTMVGRKYICVHAAVLTAWTIMSTQNQVSVSHGSAAVSVYR